MDYGRLSDEKFDDDEPPERAGGAMMRVVALPFGTVLPIDERLARGE